MGLRLLRLPEDLEIIVMLLCAPVLLRERELTRAAAAGLAALVAATLLVKLSAGVVALGVTGVTVGSVVLIGPRPAARRTACAALWAGLVALLALWLLTRQNLGDLPAYADNAVQILSGHADAAAIEEPGRGWEYAAAALGSVIAAVAIARAGRGLPRISRVAVAAAFAVFGLITFRHGFVRHGGHSMLFFAPAMAAMAALVPRARLAAPLAAAVVFAIGALSMRDEADIFRLSTAPTVDAIQTLASGQRGAFRRELARISAQQQLAVPPAMLKRLRGSTVHVDPWNAGVAWAHPDVLWAPAPSFQSHTTYTAELDRENAAFLDSSRAPRFVLRHPEIPLPERRNPRFDSPTWNLRLLCRYRGLMSSPSWLLLERIPDRCGRPQPMGSRQVRFQRRVPVPLTGSDDFVVASFRDIHEPVWQALARLALKREVTHVRTAAGVHRFVQGTAQGCTLCGCPRASSAGRSSTGGPTTQWRSGATPGPSRGATVEAGDYTVSFWRVPFRCPASRGP